MPATEKIGYLAHFKSIRPRFETSQVQSFDWLAAAHTKAESLSSGVPLHSPAMQAFQSQIKERFQHVGCKPEDIQKRGHALADFLHQEWEEMEIFSFKNSAQGENLAARNHFYTKTAELIFDQFFQDSQTPPSDLIHVTCTGYASPSPAQKLVSKKNWGEQTTVTHAYHMGCYAAIPAIRMGRGFARKNQFTDIVHTELCTLHHNPLKHTSDQLVVQSLFADGFIKYSLMAEKPRDAPSLKILGILEEVIPDTAEHMQWNLDSYGFQFALSRQIPVHLSKNILPFFERLSKKAGLSKETLIDSALFAIHPGGPKIVKYAQSQLQCSQEQVSVSYKILREFGNMSSCTLPHMWQEICLDDTISLGTKIVSLGFGPGLTIAGIILEKG